MKLTSPPSTTGRRAPRPEEWSSWRPLDAFDSLPDGPGLYRLRCRDGERVQSIARAAGVDGSGLLYIGAANSSIRGSIYGFHRCASDPAADGHPAGKSFAHCDYGRQFPLGALEVSHLSTPDAAAAQALRDAALRTYVEYFLDAPPLNLAVSAADSAAQHEVPATVEAHPGVRGLDAGGIPSWSPVAPQLAGPASGDAPRPFGSGPGARAAGEPSTPFMPSTPSTPSTPASRRSAARAAIPPPKRPAAPIDYEPFVPLVEGDHREYIVCAQCGRVMGGPADGPRPSDWADWAGTDDDAQCTECGSVGDAHLYHSDELIEALRAAGYPDPEQNPGLPPWDGREGFGRWTVPPVLRRILIAFRQ